MATRLVILGSTGSIGRSALDVIRHDPRRFEVVGLAAHSNIELLEKQIAEFKPSIVGVFDEDAAARLAAKKLGPEIRPGREGVDALAGERVDVVLCAVVGAAGLTSLLSAIDAGNRIALANKESLVMAGQLIMERAQRNGVVVLPVDSEHNAIYQCLEGHRREDVHRIHLTASGGPFYGRSLDTLAEVSAEEAARHPTWEMGKKISVDSATLMNKGLEVIEAMWLFDMPVEKIDVIIHPQSIVHSLVEFLDGSILAHLGVTDMKLPIQFALTWPERVQSSVDRLDLTALGAITFDAPDLSDFPCLGCALDAARAGGTAPTVLNASNEAAVEAFCDGRIAFLQIADVVKEVMNESSFAQAGNLEAVLDADAQARRQAEAVISGSGVQLG